MEVEADKESLYSDGIDFAVDGLEDASKYPFLIAEMLSRGWTDTEVTGLMGGNLLRVMDDVDKTAKGMADLKPSPAIFEERKDLPMDQEEYLPDVVAKYLRERTKAGTLPPGFRRLPA